METVPFLDFVGPFYPPTMVATAKKSPGRPSPIMCAVLAAVLERPGHGYDLYRRVQLRLGPAWDVNDGTIYGLLDRLEQNGLLRREDKVVPGSTPRETRVHIVYYATEQAEEFRRQWLMRPTHRMPVRSEMMAKLASARPGDEPFLLASLDEYERDILRMLETYSGEQRIDEPGLAGVLLRAVDDGVIASLKAERSWVSRTRQRIMEHRNQA